ncbi:hypothetical protein COCSUDRAFT_83581 [Coccomyxa subellipsoidea C-169]|uniref:LNS2/PITP domain-containing protein n=1 Tax=Coccomyxa subellipsoidea (strain C-169) TaxID=574566 RepID=I0Z8Q3_COCSC|nr:hypothetical protein COCSUDRAFT_83581 [Coccomyxa subellipsoidea C-169]EIE27022.1 hypothetical protein COCSUDRAFT_83581 [Coccomyxa subellipsoidea C-169]|eukprot:XP_005651566.1 hypothetical protein COCSUDRAFT_83581 [Coccomyxa subellipsoidea C-169]
MVVAGSGNDDDEDLSSPVARRGPSSMSFLQTQSGNMQGVGKQALYRRAVSSAKREDGNAAINTLTETTLLDALAAKENERGDVRELKQELLALMLAMHQRIQSLETLQDQQNSAIQDLMKGLAASTGQEAGPEIDRQPFISGTFEYGMGRPAAKRKIYLFANKAQDQEALTAATVQFMGVFKSDKRGKLNSVPVPLKIANTPGHYSIVGLLPEDHTFSKGSLFILAPGTKCVIFDLDVYYSVGNFKVAYMESLKAKGLELFAAYGNTGTDARAYAAAGIPKERTFMVGPHGGKWDTVKVDNFTDHIPDIFKFPDAEVPIPYTELLITAVPGYKKVAKATTDSVEDPDATLSVSDSADVEEDDNDDSDADEATSGPPTSNAPPGNVHLHAWHRSTAWSSK